MTPYGQIIPSLLFAIIIFTAVAVFPVAVSAATPDPGLVPCGTKDLNGDGIIKDVKGQTPEECHFSDIITLIGNITNFFIIAGSAISTLAFGYAGFLMMTAAGEMGKIEEAKAIFGKVLIGFLFMLSAWLIVHSIEAAFLDTTNADPAKRFNSFLTPPTP